ncbi:hypothetical protein COY00_00575 [Candidatus Pacearchaeota archaeon CG_4_10_14_0_2_um_filter_35_33]|nr:MAG: hypothetical protein COY79_02870 [Candidatus Pacearchaeota archaeon CG_4_10_14_0_8_um_filter_35_169]PIZ80604.1 MAG: hypothetical protein COY00_00575 [Candidatus Pacearchaeota archaeon CG_4_10_14_0_2_um_filter_35_33]PJB93827.1 MAG: hypothetical protein CO081_03925 [Candidatus Pacearchaeota archaeon CG_4_9_14_0_8_um_filter_35_24]
MKERHAKHDDARSQYHMYGHTLIRMTVGLLFVIMGFSKLKNPSGIIGMLGNIGFPAATFFGWLLLLSELIFGALILVGYKVKYTAWPLAIILVVAVLTVTIPNEGISSATAFFHYISIAALISLAWTGPGELAVSEVR